MFYNVLAQKKDDYSFIFKCLNIFLAPNVRDLAPNVRDLAPNVRDLVPNVRFVHIHTSVFALLRMEKAASILCHKSRFELSVH